ncbi:hypothetical protein CEXT_369521 [Caerostris extrusa]|uniref:Uncharacterized protein n=1 Tax=Caerostris extrusa TaxID=172846 RepID=A0AAV4ST31_CAEEX|nr:hypothetical protein CEXT_369521 [Caerostris extrusa]
MKTLTLNLSCMCTIVPKKFSLQSTHTQAQQVVLLLSFPRCAQLINYRADDFPAPPLPPVVCEKWVIGQVAIIKDSMETGTSAAHVSFIHCVCLPSGHSASNTEVNSCLISCR